MGKKTYNETPTKRRKAKVRARIYVKVFPVLSEEEAPQRSPITNNKKERNKRKEKEAKPISQLPCCRDDNPAPNTSASGTIQSRSFFLRFMQVILHYLQLANHVSWVGDIILYKIYFPIERKS